MNILSQDTIEKIKKWQVTSALRGVTLFDNGDQDGAVYEYVLQLTELQNQRNAKDRLLRIAEEFINLGLTDSEYICYQTIVDEIRKEKRQIEWQNEMDSNLTVQKLRNHHQLTETVGRGKKPRYFKMVVNTEQHGIINIKARTIPLQGYSLEYKIVWECALPTGEKIKHQETHSKYSLLPQINQLGLPQDWFKSSYVRQYTTLSNTKEEMFWMIAALIVDQVTKRFRNPVVKKARNRRKTVV